MHDNMVMHGNQIKLMKREKRRTDGSAETTHG